MTKYLLLPALLLAVSSAMAQQGTLRPERVIITNLDDAGAIPDDLIIRNSNRDVRIAIGLAVSDDSLAHFYDELDNLAVSISTVASASMVTIWDADGNAVVSGGIQSGSGYFQVLGEDANDNVSIQGGSMTANDLLVRTSAAGGPAMVRWDDTAGTGGLVSLLGYDGSGASYSLYWPGTAPSGSSCDGTCFLRIDETTGQMSFGPATTSLELDNGEAISWADSGGTQRILLRSFNGNFAVGHVVAPDSGGDTTIFSTVGSSMAGMVLEARGDGVQVWRRADTITLRPFLGDNDNPFEAYIGHGVNLLSSSLIRSQALFEDEDGTGEFVYLLGPNGTGATYALALPAAAPSVGQVLGVGAFSGGVYEMGWTSTGGGAAGSSNDIQINIGGSFGVRTGFTHDGEELRLPRSAANPATEGGQLYFVGGTTAGVDYVLDVGAGNFRLGTSSGSDRDFSIQNFGAGELNLKVFGNVTFGASATYDVGSDSDPARYLHATQLRMPNLGRIQVKDGGGTLREYFHVDNVGTAWIGTTNAATGGDLILRATAGGASPIHVALDATAADAGNLSPASGDTIALGTSSFPWGNTSYLKGTVNVLQPTGGQSGIVTIQAGSGEFTRLGSSATSTHTLAFPVGLPGGTECLQLRNLGGSVGQIEPTGAGCGAGDMILSATQTVTGTKTFSTNPIQLTNSNTIRWADAGGTQRTILQATNGNVSVGPQVAPSANGDLFLFSTKGSTSAGLTLEARNDNVQVLRRVTGTTTRAFLGDNNFPWEAYIGVGVNLLSALGGRAQILMENENSNNEMLLLGPNGSGGGYVLAWPSSAPSVGQALVVVGFSGGVYELGWL